MLTAPHPSIGFANSPPGAHAVFRGSHTSILSVKCHCSSQACQSCCAAPLWDANKATSILSKNHEGDWSCTSALKLLPSFLQGVAGAKRGERASVPTGLCCGPACGQQETGRKGNMPGHAWPQRTSTTTGSKGPEALGSLITHLPWLSISSLA